MSKVNLTWGKCEVELNVKEDLIENLKKVFSDFVRFYKEDRFIEFLKYFQKTMELETLDDQVKFMKMVHTA